MKSGKIVALLLTLIAFLGLPASTQADEVVLVADVVSQFFFAPGNNAKYPKSLQVVQVVQDDRYADFDEVAIVARIFFEPNEEEEAPVGRKSKLTAKAELERSDGTRVLLGRVKASDSGNDDELALGVKKVSPSPGLRQGDIIHWEVTRIRGPKFAEGSALFFQLGVGLPELAE